MATFPFNAYTEKSDWTKFFETPLECAQFQWENSQTIDTAGFENLCELAKVHLRAYNHLFKLAKDCTKYTDEQKILLFDILVQGKPAPTAGDKLHRNEQLRRIADDLVRDYGLHLTRSPATKDRGGVDSASSILAQLVGMPSESTINGIFGGCNQK
jgi:hypothetical protein